MRALRKFARRMLGRDRLPIPSIPPYPVFEPAPDAYTLPPDFEDEFLPARRFMIIAHRGARLDATENTLEAFRLARQQGANVIETDIRLSADGYVVLHHDPDLAPSKGGGLVAGKTLDELQSLDVPTLEDAFLEFPDLGYILDMKVEDDCAAEKTVAIIKKHDMRHNALFEGYFTYLDNLRYWRMPRLELTEHMRTGDPASRNLMDQVHRDGRFAYATAHEAKRMRILIDLGVDGIFTPHIKTLARVARKAGVMK